MSQVEKVDPLAAMKEAAEDVVSGDVGLRLLRAAEAVAELVAAARGACNTLRESAKQHRLAGDAGHASHCETLADHTDAALRPFTGERA